MYAKVDGSVNLLNITRALFHGLANQVRDFRIRMSFIAWYVYTYEEFVFLTEATAVQQNDSDRTKNTNNKKKN